MKITELPDDSDNLSHEHQNGNHGNGHGNQGNGHGNQGNGHPAGAPLPAEVVAAHDSAVAAALNSVMAATDQTYDDFMDGFMHLTPDDVLAFESRRAAPPTVPVTLSSSSTSVSTTAAAAAAEVRATDAARTSSQIRDTCSQGKDHASDSSDLEEECLGEGETIPSRFMRPESPGRLKMGNYIDEEDSDSDAQSDDECGYLASFVTSAISQSKDQSPLDEDVDHQATSYRHSNKQTNVDSDQSESHPSESQTKNTLAEPKQLKSHQTETESEETTGKKSERLTTDSKVTDLEDDVDLASSDVIETMRIPPPSSSNSHRKSVLDSTGEYVEVGREESDATEADSDLDEELVYDASLDRPNPGEVEQEEVVRRAAHRNSVTRLDFTDRGSSQSENIIQSTTPAAADTPTTDAVEQFVLDEDFDYDNVVLTPKFNSDEMRILREAMAGQNHVCS